jgi:hypothetical protein
MQRYHHARSKTVPSTFQEPMKQRPGTAESNPVPGHKQSSSLNKYNSCKRK